MWCRRRRSRTSRRGASDPMATTSRDMISAQVACPELHLQHDRLEVGPADIEDLIEILEHRIDVRGRDAGAGRGERVAGAVVGRRLRQDVRAGAPGEIVEQQRHGEQQQRVRGDRPKHEAVSEALDRCTAINGTAPPGG
jgi:hypothetical protein